MPTSYGKIGQKYHFFVDFIDKIRYIVSMYNKKTEKNTMKKILEYMTIFLSVLGTLCMFGAVESIEIDKWMQGFSIAFLGIASFILALYSQTLYSEEK